MIINIKKKKKMREDVVVVLLRLICIHTFCYSCFMSFLFQLAVITIVIFVHSLLRSSLLWWNHFQSEWEFGALTNNFCLSGIPCSLDKHFRSCWKISNTMMLPKCDKRICLSDFSLIWLLSISGITLRSVINTPFPDYNTPLERA